MSFTKSSDPFDHSFNKNQEKGAHMSEPECIFCKERENSSLVKDFAHWWPTDSRIIYRDEHIMVVPGLGPIVPNKPYVLIIPKTCAPSFLDTPYEEQLSMFTFLEKLRQMNDIFPSKILLVFEHGSTIGNAGCSCISHCHLHVMSIDGRQAMLPEYLKKKTAETSEVDFFPGITGKGPYLFAGHYGVQNSQRITGYICRNHPRENQMIRNLVAELTDGVWDYRRGVKSATMFWTYGEILNGLKKV